MDSSKKFKKKKKHKNPCNLFDGQIIFNRFTNENIVEDHTLYTLHMQELNTAGKSSVDNNYHVSPSLGTAG